MSNLTSYLRALGDQVRPGQRLSDALTAERLNAIMGAIRAIARGENIVAGDGLRKRSVAEGVLFSSYAFRTAAESHPFKVVNMSADGTNKVKVVFGQVNSVTPTIGGTALDATTPPLLTVGASSGVVYLRVNLNAYGVITTAIIDKAASLPAQTATEGYLTLAAFTVSGGGALAAINQSVTHSLGHQKCGTTTHNFWGI